jgi:hypothetical protein
MISSSHRDWVPPSNLHRALTNKFGIGTDSFGLITKALTNL